MGARQATYTFAPQERLRGERHRLLSFFQFLATLVLIGLFVLTAIGGVILYKEYRFYLKLRSEVDSLGYQVTVFDQEFRRLTSREEVLKRARKLGLHTPRPEQIVELQLR